MNEKELLVPVAVEELAALEAMAMLGNFKTMDFEAVTAEIDKRAEEVEGDLKGLINFMALVYAIFEMNKNGKKETAQRFSGEIAVKAPGIAPLAAELLDELEESWRGNE